MPYMTVDDLDAFVGLERKQPKYLKNPIECPKCKGFGRWHLELNEYGPGRHFDAACGQCNGYGYVEADSKSATCLHEWKERTVGRCLHEWTCTKCDERRVYDSSD